MYPNFRKLKGSDFICITFSNNLSLFEEKSFHICLPLCTCVFLKRIWLLWEQNVVHKMNKKVLNDFKNIFRWNSLYNRPQMFFSQNI